MKRIVTGLGSHDFEARKFHDLPLANARNRKARGLTQCDSKGLRTREVDVISPHMILYAQESVVAVSKAILTSALRIASCCLNSSREKEFVLLFYSSPQQIR